MKRISVVQTVGTTGVRQEWDFPAAEVVEWSRVEGWAIVKDAGGATYMLREVLSLVQHPAMQVIGERAEPVED